jgi:hypothetical protein
MVVLVMGYTEAEAGVVLPPRFNHWACMVQDQEVVLLLKTALMAPPIQVVEVVALTPLTAQTQQLQLATVDPVR